jgi:hypothetical protein
MADKASGRVLARRDRGAPAASEQNLTLRTNFARAVMMTKGPTDESRSAFDWIRKLEEPIPRAAGHWSGAFGEWARHYFRGELPAARANAQAYLRDAETAGLAKEVGIGLWALGMTCLRQGELGRARSSLERAAEVYAPGDDREVLEVGPPAQFSPSLSGFPGSPFAQEACSRTRPRKRKKRATCPRSGSSESMRSFTPISLGSRSVFTGVGQKPGSMM